MIAGASERTAQSDEVTFRIYDASSFGAAVREFRARRGLSQAELSERCAINRTYLSALEQGHATEYLERLMQVLSELGVRVILTGEP